MNPFLLTDGYKLSHHKLYPPNTQLVVSNFTPRKSRVPNSDKMVFFGLQYILDEYLVRRMNDEFFLKPKSQVCGELKEFFSNYLQCDYDVSHFERLHDKGYLPICIRALHEGTAVPMGIPAMVIFNTDPDFYWLTNYLETMISNLLWKSCTSATTAMLNRRTLEKYAKETGASPEFVQWQGHDFSYRGMSGTEDAVMSGAAHLVYFSGTDTLPAIKFVQDYYGEVLAGSVPASEHSVTSAGGETNELETIRRWITEVYPTGILSVVSDTWDLFKLISEDLPLLKNEIMTREGKLVIRPDSGVPHLIINGNPDSECPLEKKGVMRILYEQFGGTKNAAGYIELDPHIGVIYGDAITPEEMVKILDGMKAAGFCSSNMVFGVGSYTYQYVTRDTYGTVCKATYCIVDGEARNIHKNPKTGAWKKSHKGLLVVNDKLECKEEATWEEFVSDDNAMVTRFLDGVFYPVNFEDIQKVAKTNL